MKVGEASQIQRINWVIMSMYRWIDQSVRGNEIDSLELSKSKSFRCSKMGLELSGLQKNGLYYKKKKPIRSGEDPSVEGLFSRDDMR